MKKASGEKHTLKIVNLIYYLNNWKLVKEFLLGN